MRSMTCVLKARAPLVSRQAIRAPHPNGLLAAPRERATLAALWSAAL
jgi:hypothetical protein